MAQDFFTVSVTLKSKQTPMVPCRFIVSSAVEPSHHRIEPSHHRINPRALTRTLLAVRQDS
jgi:hypothetical protein